MTADAPVLTDREYVSTARLAARLERWAIGHPSPVEATA